MKFLAMSICIVFSGQAIADILPQGDSNYQCQTTGGFFDFSPNHAIATCQREIDEFCKSKGAPPIIGKITGVPSGYARYARAEISFQCMTEADIAQKQQKTIEAENQQVKAEIENSKRLCQQDFGFIPNTPEFGNCLLELQKQHFANRRAAQEVAAQKEMTEAELAQKRQSEADQATINAIQSINKAIAPSTTTTNCSAYGSNISCTSTNH
ncbi:MAG: hypothetical protein EPO06_05600 [Burkholderiaceae bacterium]|nr:MAG: hypothetical protein EPO06_05600 [Burkholderiaceae bacterium]